MFLKILLSGWDLGQLCNLVAMRQDGEGIGKGIG